MNAYVRFVRKAAVGLLLLLLLLVATVSWAQPAHAESGPDRSDGESHRHPGHDCVKRRTAGGRCTTTFQFTGATTIHSNGQCNLRHLGASTLSAEQITAHARRIRERRQRQHLHRRQSRWTYTGYGLLRGQGELLSVTTGLVHAGFGAIPEMTIIGAVGGHFGGGTYSS